MATLAEQRWINENRGLALQLFGVNPGNGLVADYVRSWYNDLGNSAPALDETDSAIYDEFGWRGTPAPQPIAAAPSFVDYVPQNDRAPVAMFGRDVDGPNYGDTGENTVPPPGYKRGPDGVSWVPDDDNPPPQPIVPPGTIPVNNDPTVIGSSTYDPTGGLSGGSTGGGGGNPPYSNYPLDNSGVIFGPSSGGGGGWGGLGGQGGMILPLPGIGWPAAIAASIILSNGNPLAGGGSLSGTINNAGNAITNPIGAIGSSIQNLGNGLAGPQGWGGAAAAIPISFPSGSGIGSGIPPATTQPPIETGGGPIVAPVGGSIDFPNGAPVNSGATVTAPPIETGGSTTVLPLPSGSPIGFPNGTPQGSGATVNTDGLFGTTPTPVVPIPGGQPGPAGADTTTGAGSLVTPINPPSNTGTDAPNPPTSTPVIPVGGGSSGGDNPTPGSTPVVPVTPGTGGVSPTPIVPLPTTPTMPTPGLPNPRSYYGEGNQSTQDLAALWPGISNLYGNASRSYGTTDYGNFGNILSQYGSSNGQLTNMANQQTVDSNTALRQGNVNDIGAFGGQALGYLQQLNPNQYNALNQAQAGAAGGIQQSPYQAQLGAAFGAGPSYTSVNPYMNFNSVQTGFNAPAVNAQTGFNGVQAAQGDYGLGVAAGQLSRGGPSDIQTTLEQQARDQLALGGSLSAQDRNLAQQTAREAWGARGLVNSPGAVGAEILNTDALSRQRLAERTASAQQIDATGFGQRQQGFSNALGFSGAAQNYAGLGLQGQQANLGAQLQGNQLGYQGQVANQNAALQAQQLGLQGQQSNLQAQLAGNQQGLQAGLANQNAGLQAQQQNYGLGQSLLGTDYARQQQNYGNVLQNAQLQTQAAFNPFATITSANTANQGTNQNLFGQTAGLSSGAYGNQFVQNAFNPYNNYSQDVYNTNYNAANAQYLSGQNNAAAIQGANTQANSQLLNNFLGSLAGLYGSGAFSCWVARAVFGEDSPKVQKFRRWMLTRGPKWFRTLYIKHGEAFAAWLQDHAWLKPAIRAFMETKVAALHRYDHALAA